MAGETECKCRAFAFFALRVYFAAMGLDGVFGDGKTQAAAAAGTGLICFVKTLEDMR